MRITLKDLVTELPTKTYLFDGKSRNNIQAILECFVTVIANHIIDGDELYLNGLGTIKAQVVDRAERKSRNPRTGEIITVPAKKAVKARINLQKKLKAELLKQH